MVITLEVPSDLEARLQKAARLQGKDVDRFLLDGARDQVRYDILPRPEAELLEVINAPIAPDARRRRDALIAEQKRRELTSEEQNTLYDLIDAVEIANAHRWQCVADLAKRRGVSFAEIARELGIPLTPPNPPLSSE